MSTRSISKYEVKEEKMRDIHYDEIVAVVRDLCITANYQLTEDVQNGLREAQEREASDVGRSLLQNAVDNFTYAQAHQLPICQDTGMAMVFCRLGQEVHVTGGLLQDAINEGVRRGYLEGCLRCSIVEDPLRRVNTDDNTPAIVHLELTAGDKLHITVAPKGFGSENMSVLKMFKPSVTQEEIESFVVDTVDKAGSNPCPPVIVGVGLGGTSEYAGLLAKEALLLPLNRAHPDPYYADMEYRILERINDLGIGPQGLGGTVTALSVKILTHPTHIAGLPCMVNLGCHVTRHATAIL
jgi:fumarate hydratase subunit alpha